MRCCYLVARSASSTNRCVHALAALITRIHLFSLIYRFYLIYQGTITVDGWITYSAAARIAVLAKSIR